MEKDFYKNIDKIIAEAVCNLSAMNVNFPDDRHVIQNHLCKKLCCRAMTWQQIESASYRTTREMMQSLLKSAYIERYCMIQAGNFNKPWFQDLEHFIIEAKKVLIECGIKELV